MTLIEGSGSFTSASTTVSSYRKPAEAEPPEEHAAYRRVVVGIDGTPGSRTALVWSAREARARGAVLDVVSVWRYPPTTTTYSGYVPFEQWQGEARTATEKEIDEVLGEHMGLTVRVSAHNGPPARVLFDAAEGAELLVVGAPSHVGVTSAIASALDFMSSHEAPCPLVVVPRHVHLPPEEGPRPLYL